MEKFGGYEVYSNTHQTRNELGGNIHLLQSGDNEVVEEEDTRLLWGDYTSRQFVIHQGVGEHIAMFQSPNLEFNAKKLLEILQRIEFRKLVAAHQSLNLELLGLLQEKSLLEEGSI